METMKGLNFTVFCWSLWFVVSSAASCLDKGYFCWIWKTTGKCKRSSDYAVRKCQKTCDFCPVSTVSPTTTDVSPTFKITDPPTSSKPAECHFKPLPISRERFWDKQLHGHVIRHQSVISEIQCEDLCLRVPGCLAYNYQYSGENNEAWTACELMNRVTAVKDSVGYSFRLFERERAIKNLLGSCLGDT